MRRRGFPQAHASIPNLAPMVDVVMVILIFFMLGTSFAVMEGTLQTNLPSQVADATGGNVSIIPLIRISLARVADSSCQIQVMNEAMPPNGFSDLQQFLSGKMNAGADAASRVLISARPDVRYQDVISTMDASRRAGFTRIQFSLGGKAVSAPERDG